MSEDERRIRALISRWADGVRRADLEAVLADHTADLVQYHVTPPHEGLRGLAAYRAMWPPFFAWQADSGAVFEIDTLEVGAGRDAAFAHALVRCGSPAELAEQPTLRLRVTFGLRKRLGRWVIAHEHHSFPHD
ncbi:MULTISPECIES: YybH family protein [unclassified Streptomyces]|uniref:YybH family protein n=1 Tax=unclassified Streptomyces TaxID=2593676 RepID=UPI003828CDBF